MAGNRIGGEDDLGFQNMDKLTPVHGSRWGLNVLSFSINQSINDFCPILTMDRTPRKSKTSTNEQVPVKTMLVKTSNKTQKSS